MQIAKLVKNAVVHQRWVTALNWSEYFQNSFLLEMEICEM